ALGTLGADLDFANRRKILVEPVAVILAELRVQGAGFGKHGVENAAATMQSTALAGDSPLRLLEKLSKDDARIALGRQRDAIGAVSKRMPLVAEFERREPRLRGRHLGDQLIDGNG